MISYNMNLYYDLRSILRTIKLIKPSSTIHRARLFHSIYDCVFVVHCFFPDLTTGCYGIHFLFRYIVYTHEVVRTHNLITCGQDIIYIHRGAYSLSRTHLRKSTTNQYKLKQNLTKQIYIFIFYGLYISFILYSTTDESQIMRVNNVHSDNITVFG